MLTLLETSTLQRQARILVLLDAASKAGLAPMQVLPFHAFAFLANVLAPVWDMPALDGKILKRKGGPFYPGLQRDLDRLVGMGMVLITRVSHVQEGTGKWRLEGSYELNELMAKAPLAFLQQLPDERRLASFIEELAYALSALSDLELERALVEDATYSNPSFSANNVVDFDEWTKKNPSTNVANYFDRLMPNATKATPGEKLHLYLRHLRRRAYAR